MSDVIDAEFTEIKPTATPAPERTVVTPEPVSTKGKELVPAKSQGMTPAPAANKPSKAARIGAGVARAGNLIAGSVNAAGGVVAGYLERKRDRAVSGGEATLKRAEGLSAPAADHLPARHATGPGNPVSAHTDPGPAAVQHAEYAPSVCVVCNTPLTSRPHYIGEYGPLGPDCARRLQRRGGAPLMHQSVQAFGRSPPDPVDRYYTESVDTAVAGWVAGSASAERRYASVDYGYSAPAVHYESPPPPAEQSQKAYYGPKNVIAVQGDLIVNGTINQS